LIFYIKHMKKQFYIIFITCAAVLSQCTNPFSTRTPEEPDLRRGTGISDNSLQTDPNRILEKIEQAFEMKDSRAYRACFADKSLVGVEFSFIAEDTELPRLPDWTLDDEERYFNNLVSSATVDFAVIPESPIPTPVSNSPDTLQLDYEYVISVAQLRASNERYTGRSIMRILKAPDELWYIYEWHDLRVSRASQTDSTWSTLKANFRISP